MSHCLRKNKFHYFSFNIVSLRLIFSLKNLVQRHVKYICNILVRKAWNIRKTCEVYLIRKTCEICCPKIYMKYMSPKNTRYIGQKIMWNILLRKACEIYWPERHVKYIVQKVTKYIVKTLMKYITQICEIYWLERHKMLMQNILILWRNLKYNQSVIT